MKPSTKSLIDFHIQGSKENPKEALTQKLTQLWQQAKNQNTPQEAFTLFEFGNQKTLIKSQFSSNLVKIYHDDFSFDRAANQTIKQAIREFLQKNNINTAIFLDSSGGQAKAKQAAYGFFSDGNGARMDVTPLQRESVTPEEVQAAHIEIKNKFPDLKLDDIATAKLVASHKGLSDSAALFTNNIPGEKLSLQDTSQKQEVTLINPQKSNRLI